MSYMIITFKFNLIHSVWNHLCLPLNLNIIDLLSSVVLIIMCNVGINMVYSFDGGWVLGPSRKTHSPSTLSPTQPAGQPPPGSKPREVPLHKQYPGKTSSGEGFSLWTSRGQTSDGDVIKLRLKSFIQHQLAQCIGMLYRCLTTRAATVQVLTSKKQLYAH